MVNMEKRNNTEKNKLSSKGDRRSLASSFFSVPKTSNKSSSKGDGNTKEVFGKYDFENFYKEYKFSPRQEIDDYDKHVRRREELYRHLGLLPGFFKNKRVIEIGPAGGYNALVVADWNPDVLYLVEPSEIAVERINENFKDNGLMKNGKIKIINDKLENAVFDEGFDIVICEAMIHGITNKEEVLNNIDNIVKVKGVLVITCIDEISYFYELMRKYFSYELIKEISSNEDKINILLGAFESHLRSLIGSNKNARDWVIDNLISDVILHNDFFSISDCIKFFNNRYKFYNSSPKIFVDYRWYKMIPEDLSYNNIVLSEFEELRHNLLNCNVNVSRRSRGDNEELFNLCKYVKEILYYLIVEKKDMKRELIITIDKIGKNLSNADIEIVRSIEEIIKLLNIDTISIDDLKNNDYFKKSFGRALQYVSLTKN